MAILVYKPGNTIKTRGVDVDFKRIEVRELDFYLEEGYKTDPKKLLIKDKPKATYDEDSLKQLHWKKVDVIAKSLGIDTEGDKKETIQKIIEAQNA